jgi:hypothetical protein
VKVVVYLLMLLLLGPIERLLGSIVGAVFLAGLLGLGVWLLLRRTNRRGNDPQRSESPGTVVVVSQSGCLCATTAARPGWHGQPVVIEASGQQCPHVGIEAHRQCSWMP